MMHASLVPLIALLPLAACVKAAQPARTLAPVAPMEQAQALGAICDMKAGDAPIKLTSKELVIRFSVYVPMRLVGPQSCRKVAFYIPNRELSRRFERLLFARENKKEYVFFLEVLVDGMASYDAKEDHIRLDVDKMGVFRTPSECPVSTQSRRSGLADRLGGLFTNAASG